MGIFKDHLDEVVNKSWNYAGRLEDDKDHILNAMLGLAGEAGEVADHHKKLFYHTKRDEKKAREELKLELGDVIFYWLKLVDLYGFTFKEILQANREKLMERHEHMFKSKEKW